MEPTAVAVDQGFIVSAFKGGGPFMFAILAFAVLTLGLILERTFYFFARYKAAPADFRQRVLESVLRGDDRAAIQTAKTYAHTAIGRIALIGLELREQGAGEEEVQARMDERLAKEISTIDQRTGFLAMFGNVATLLGLLGTIVGMIHSFAAVASASPAERSILLSRGISEAMNCTAFGLLTAIPALVAFAYFQNKTEKVVGLLTEQTTEIYHDLIFMAEARSTRKSVQSTARVGGMHMSSASTPGPLNN